MNVLSWLSSTWTYFSQVVSLSNHPVSVPVMDNWSSLVDLISWLLTNPFFYWIIGVILLMGILPSVDDD